MGALLNFIPGIGPVLANWKLIAMGLLGLALAFFAWDWEHRGRVIEEQQVAISVLQGDLLVANKQKDIAVEAETLVAKRLVEARTQGAKITTIIEGARNAPVTDDGALAPVLRNVLVGIGGLQPARHP